MNDHIRHLYVHIPFCPTKCSYCAFVNHVGGEKLIEPYIRAVKGEADMQQQERAGGTLETIYFGGGTPSTLDPGQVQDLIQHFDELWGIEPGAEVTMEGHPQTVTGDRVRHYVEAGVNRMSFGIESLQPAELVRLGRSHDPEQGLDVIRVALEGGVRNLAADLMYGIPDQTLASWRDTLLKLLATRVDHISLYPLSIEPRTVFARRWKQGQLEIPDDDLVVEMYDAACELLREAGFVHYEVANWARPSHECRHNLAYWHNREFYAIGVGAHGFLRPHRVRNVERTRQYIDMVLSGASPRVEAIEMDQPSDAADARVLGLRLLHEGIDLQELLELHNDSDTTAMSDLDELITHGLLRKNGGRLLLTETAVPVANEIFQRFLN